LRRARKGRISISWRGRSERSRSAASSWARQVLSRMSFHGW
jgi:hypothetical protein